MRERIKWNNFIPKDSPVGTDVTKESDLNPGIYPEASHCEARVMFMSRELSQGSRLVTAEFSCQKCEWGKRAFTVVNPDDSRKPLREIREVKGLTVNYLRENCPTLKEHFEASEIRPEMLPPILRGS